MLKLKNYFSLSEIVLWISSVLVIVGSFCIFDRMNYMTLPKEKALKFKAF